MRRQIRIAFHALGVLSLALAVGVAALWVRSYWRADYFYCSRSHTKVPGEPWQRFDVAALYSVSGQFSLFVNSERLDAPDLKSLGWNSGDALQGSQSNTLRGFFRWHDIRIYHGHFRGLVMTHWIVVSAFLVLPATALVMTIRKRKRHGTHCVVCGYDLRATPDRCPECGTAKAP